MSDAKKLPAAIAASSEQGERPRGKVGGRRPGAGRPRGTVTTAQGALSFLRASEMVFKRMRPEDPNVKPQAGLGSFLEWSSRNKEVFYSRILPQLARLQTQREIAAGMLAAGGDGLRVQYTLDFGLGADDQLFEAARRDALEQGSGDVARVIDGEAEVLESLERGEPDKPGGGASA